MTDSTPRPWKSNGRFIHDSEGNLICVVTDLDRYGEDPLDGKKRQAMEAGLIVRAVNNHEQLMRSIKELSKWEAHYRETHDLHGDGATETGRAWDLMRRAGEQTRAALAKVEDES